jgi:hypothetical protein
LQTLRISRGFAFLAGAIPRINFVFSQPPLQRVESAEVGLKVKALIEGDSK